jgi:hypothetical protein
LMLVLLALTVAVRLLGFRKQATQVVGG